MEVWLMGRLAWIAFAIGSAAFSCSAVGQGPVLASGSVIYSPIAKAAHLDGEAVVRFSIGNDGRPVDVEAVSGPEFLPAVLAAQIKGWQFVTPLPVNVGSERYVARYSFHLLQPGAEMDDALDGPPAVVWHGDVVEMPGANSTVDGTVRSEDGTQTIAVKMPGAVSVRACPKEAMAPPDSRSLNDSLELFHGEGPGFRVRVFRDGRVDWRGLDGVKVMEPAASRIDAAIADAMIQRVSTAEFWRACSLELPGFDEPIPEDKVYGDYDYFTLSIGGVVRSVGRRDIAGDEFGVKLAWAIGRAVNTHQWIHGDAAMEPTANMPDELSMPKLGVTALIRATNRYDPVTTRRTLEPLKYMLAKGDDPNAADASGWTPLMYAARFYWGLERGPDRAQKDATALLLEAGADPNRRSLAGDTALLIAARDGFLNSDLVKARADVNAQDARGISVLMLLAQDGSADDVAEALAAGADAKAMDREGHTALDYLRQMACGKPFAPRVDRGGMVASVRLSCKDELASKSYREREALLAAAMKGTR